MLSRSLQTITPILYPHTLRGKQPLISAHNPALTLGPLEPLPTTATLGPLPDLQQSGNTGLESDRQNWTQVRFVTYSLCDLGHMAHFGIQGYLKYKTGAFCLGEVEDETQLRSRPGRNVFSVSGGLQCAG